MAKCALAADIACRMPFASKPYLVCTFHLAVSAVAATQEAATRDTTKERSLLYIFSLGGIGTIVQLSLLPRSYVAGDDLEKGVWVWERDTVEFGVALGATCFELREEMRPFVLELTLRLLDALSHPAFLYPAGVESIPPLLGFIVDSPQVGGDRGGRRALGPEANQLRMMKVAPCLAQKNSLREERFPPDSDKAFAVEIAGVNRPDAHPLLTFSLRTRPLVRFKQVDSLLGFLDIDYQG